jgi:hypothetical protein
LIGAWLLPQMRFCPSAVRPIPAVRPGSRASASSWLGAGSSMRSGSGDRGLPPRLGLLRAFPARFGRACRASPPWQVRSDRRHGRRPRSAP